ncbi:MAG: hypothetical protein ABFD81_03365 [Syntrophaceae bacterium]
MKQYDIKVMELHDLLPSCLGRVLNPSLINILVEIYLLVNTKTIIDKIFWHSLANIWFGKRKYKCALSRSVLRKIGLYNWARFKPTTPDKIFLFDEGMVQIVQNSVLSNGTFKPIIPLEIIIENIVFGIYLTANHNELFERSIRRPDFSRRYQRLDEKELCSVFETSMMEFDKHVDLLERLKPGCIHRMEPLDSFDGLAKAIIIKLNQFLGLESMPNRQEDQSDTRG